MLHGIAALHNYRGTLLDTLGRHEEALASLARAQTVLEQAIKAHPQDARFEPLLAKTHHNRGMILTALRRVDAAKAAFASAETICDRLQRAQPKVVAHQSDLANTLNSLGVLLMAHGEFAEAKGPLERAVSLRTQLHERFPNRALQSEGLALSLCNLADCLQQHRQIAQAGERLQQARVLLEKLNRQAPQVTAYRFQLGLCHALIGVVLKKSHNDRAALDASVRARNILRQLVVEHPAVPDYQHRLDRVVMRISVLHTRLGETAQRLQDYEEASTVQMRLAEANPADARLAGRVALTQHQRAVTLRQLQRREAAAAAATAAVQWYRRALAKQPGNHAHRRALAREYSLQAGIERDLGHYDAAITAIQQIPELWPDDANQLYYSAQDFAVTGGAVKAVATRQHCAQLALATLRRAVHAGFDDARRAAPTLPLRCCGTIRTLRSCS